jgi:hypothetical protein
MDAERAEEALGVLRSGRDRVLRESRRERALEIASRAVGTVLWLGVKDIRRPAARRAANVVVYAGLFGWAAWRVNKTRVMGLFSERHERLVAQFEKGMGPAEGRAEAERPALPWREQLRLATAMMTPEQKRAVVIGLVLAAGRHVAVRGFRRSGIRYPHLAAGLVVGAAQATYGFLELRRKRASDDG